MTRGSGLVGRLLLAAGLLAPVALAATPAQADSFSFGISSGYGYPRHHRHHHRHHYHPYYGPRVVYAPPPPVYYVPPPPRVVYVPAPAPAVPTVTPIGSVYQNARGQYCREYQGEIIIGGTPQPSRGTACQQPDGTWRIVN